MHKERQLKIGARNFRKYYTLEEARKNYDLSTEKNWRHRCFFEKGFDCIICKTKGLFFAVWDDRGGGVHLDLFSLTEKGEMLLMTVDHIKPLSKGGAKKAVENLQPMCRDCNREKGSDYEEEKAEYPNEFNFTPPWERKEI